MTRDDLGCYDPQHFSFPAEDVARVSVETRRVFRNACFGFADAYVELMDDRHFDALTPGMRSIIPRLPARYQHYGRSSYSGNGNSSSGSVGRPSFVGFAVNEGVSTSRGPVTVDQPGWTSASGTPQRLPPPIQEPLVEYVVENEPDSDGDYIPGYHIETERPPPGVRYTVVPAQTRPGANRGGQIRVSAPPPGVVNDPTPPGFPLPPIPGSSAVAPNSGYRAAAPVSGNRIHQFAHQLPISGPPAPPVSVSLNPASVCRPPQPPAGPCHPTTFLRQPKEKKPGQLKIREKLRRAWEGQPVSIEYFRRHIYQLEYMYKVPRDIVRDAEAMLDEMDARAAARVDPREHENPIQEEAAANAPVQDNAPDPLADLPVPGLEGEEEEEDDFGTEHLYDPMEKDAE